MNERRFVVLNCLHATHLEAPTAEDSDVIIEHNAKLVRLWLVHTYGLPEQGATEQDGYIWYDTAAASQRETGNVEHGEGEKEGGKRDEESEERRVTRGKSERAESNLSGVSIQ